LKKNHIIQSCISICLLFCLTIIAFENANGAETILLKRGAAPEIIALDGKAKILYGEFIRRQLTKKYPELQTIIVGDKRYIFITERWFREVSDWTEYFITSQVPDLIGKDKLPVAYTGTFAMLMSNIANISVAKRYNVKASVLIGLMNAYSNKPWGKIPADGKLRDYIIGLTENGSVVYNPETRQVTTGKDFPNNEYLKGIIF